MTLGSPRLELGARPRVTALIGGRRATVFTLAVAPLDQRRPGVKLDAHRRAPQRPAPRKTIARRLKVRTLPRGTFATVAATGDLRRPPPQAPAAPVPLTTAGGTPPAPGAGEPPVKARPGGRTHHHRRDAHLAGARVVRPLHRERARAPRPRAATTGAAPEALDGAPPLVYSYRFPFAEGWCDPATGAARVTFTGTVAFRYAAHGIDLVANDPEIELDGPHSRVIFRMTGSGDTAGGNQRQVVETLDVSKATVTGGGTAFAYERIPGAVPPGAASSVFAGYYLPGDPFGWVSISYTTD